MLSPKLHKLLSQLGIALVVKYLIQVTNYEYSVHLKWNLDTQDFLYFVQYCTPPCSVLTAELFWLLIIIPRSPLICSTADKKIQYASTQREIFVGLH